MMKSSGCVLSLGEHRLSLQSPYHNLLMGLVTIQAVENSIYSSGTIFCCILSGSTVFAQVWSVPKSRIYMVNRVCLNSFHTTCQGGVFDDKSGIFFPYFSIKKKNKNMWVLI